MVVVQRFLFDFGATHSFVSHACANESKLLVIGLKFELVVPIATLGQVKTTLVCMTCLIESKGVHTKSI